MSQTLFSHLPCTFADGGFGAVESFHASRHGLALSQFARKVPSTPAVALLFVTGFHPLGFMLVLYKGGLNLTLLPADLEEATCACSVPLTPS